MKKYTKKDWVVVGLAQVCFIGYLIYLTVSNPPLNISQEEFNDMSSRIIKGQDGFITQVELEDNNRQLVLTTKTHTPVDWGVTKIQFENGIAKYWCGVYPQFNKVNIVFQDGTTFGYYNCK